MRRLFSPSLRLFAEDWVCFVGWVLLSTFAISVPLVRQCEINHESVWIVALNKSELLVVNSLTRLTPRSDLPFELLADYVAYDPVREVLTGLVVLPPRLHERGLADDDRGATPRRARRAMRTAGGLQDLQNSCAARPPSAAARRGSDRDRSDHRIRGSESATDPSPSATRSQYQRRMKHRRERCLEPGTPA